MQMIVKRHLRSLLAIPLLAFATPTIAQLDRCLDAHGGLAKWRSFAGVEYDLTWKSAKDKQADHQLFDLQSRSGLITSDKYTLGKSGGEVWVKPTPLGPSRYRGSGRPLPRCVWNCRRR